MWKEEWWQLRLLGIVHFMTLILGVIVLSIVALILTLIYTSYDKYFLWNIASFFNILYFAWFHFLQQF